MAITWPFAKPGPQGRVATAHFERASDGGNRFRLVPDWVARWCGTPPWRSSRVHAMQLRPAPRARVLEGGDFQQVWGQVDAVFAEWFLGGQNAKGVRLSMICGDRS